MTERWTSLSSVRCWRFRYQAQFDNVDTEYRTECLLMLISYFLLNTKIVNKLLPSVTVSPNDLCLSTKYAVFSY
jgi:hypothetical protein